MGPENNRNQRTLELRCPKDDALTIFGSHDDPVLELTVGPLLDRAPSVNNKNAIWAFLWELLSGKGMSRVVEKGCSDRLRSIQDDQARARSLCRFLTMVDEAIRVELAGDSTCWGRHAGVLLSCPGLEGQGMLSVWYTRLVKRSFEALTDALTDAIARPSWVTEFFSRAVDGEDFPRDGAGAPCPQLDLSPEWCLCFWAMVQNSIYRTWLSKIHQSCDGASWSLHDYRFLYAGSNESAPLFPIPFHLQDGVGSQPIELTIMRESLAGHGPTNGLQELETVTYQQIERDLGRFDRGDVASICADSFGVKFTKTNTASWIAAEADDDQQVIIAAADAGTCSMVEPAIKKSLIKKGLPISCLFFYHQEAASLCSPANPAETRAEDGFPHALVAFFLSHCSREVKFLDDAAESQYLSQYPAVHLRSRTQDGLAFDYDYRVQDLVEARRADVQHDATRTLEENMREFITTLTSQGFRELLIGAARYHGERLDVANSLQAHDTDPTDLLTRIVSSGTQTSPLTEIASEVQQWLNDPPAVRAGTRAFCCLYGYSIASAAEGALLLRADSDLDICATLCSAADGIPGGRVLLQPLEQVLKNDSSESSLNSRLLQLAGAEAEVTRASVKSLVDLDDASDPGKASLMALGMFLERLRENRTNKREREEPSMDRTVIKQDQGQGEADVSRDYLGAFAKAMEKVPLAGIILAPLNKLRDDDKADERREALNQLVRRNTVLSEEAVSCALQIQANTNHIKMSLHALITYLEEERVARAESRTPRDLYAVRGSRAFVSKWPFDPPVTEVLARQEFSSLFGKESTFREFLECLTEHGWREPTTQSIKLKLYEFVNGLTGKPAHELRPLFDCLLRTRGESEVLQVMVSILSGVD